MERIRAFWNSTTERGWLKWFVRILWLGAILAVVGSIFLFYTISQSDLPSFEELENPQYDLASIIYDANDVQFGKYYIENREFIDYRDLTPNITDALYSVEDARYFHHTGIDFRALVRVAFKSVLLGQSSSGGGSTISQQLAKLLFNRESLSGKSKIQRAMALATIKFKEWITAVRLERRYTKEEIVAMYLNKFEFINGAHGVHSASEIYFGKDQKDLNVEEAAVLVGMLKNPALYNPVRFTERTKGRRDVVLASMRRNNKINAAQKDSLSLLPLDISSFHRGNQSEGIAPYFRAELTKWLRPLLQQSEYLKADGKPYDIYRDGLKIYTTIDVRYQKHAEEAVIEHLTWLQDRYWKVWRYKNPFTFEAEEGQEEIRRQGFERRIRDTEFYKNLFISTFAPLEKDIRDQYGLALKEPTIRRLQHSRSYVNEIDSDVRSKFKKLIASEDWSRVTATWKQFQDNLEDQLDEKIDSKVFAYNDEGFEMKNMSREDSILYHLRHLQAGMLSVDPRTGEIKAWVGGPSHEYFKYDHVTMRRQVGSTIKPFVYATAIGVLGLNPCQEFEDIQYTIAPGDANFKVDAEWSPSNANGTFTQTRYNLYQGLLYSKNSITVRIVKELGTVEPIRDLLHNAGIDKFERINEGRYVVPEVPSLVLGSVDLSLIEMTGAYTTFANGGIFTKPTFISRIEDKNGKVIYQSDLVQRRALNPLYNSVLVDMLQNNVGGNYGIGIKTPAGGKTGTTNDYADGWFMGVTPNLVTGTWVGGDEKWVRFYTLDDGQGFVMARPVFINYMKKVEADPEINFDTDVSFAAPPPGFANITDCTRYKQGKVEEEAEALQEEREELDDFEDIELDDFEIEDDLPEIDTSGSK